MFRTVQPEAVAAAFQHNELDVWEIGSSEDRLQQSKAAADTTLRTAPSKRGRILQIATTGALSDIKVRRGVIQAIDRATLAAVELDVAPGTVTAWSNLLLLPTQPGYVDEARATGVSFDAAQASTTLTQAGWVTGSDGLRRQNGQALELTYTLDPADSAANTEFTQLSGQLLAVGITLLPVSPRRRSDPGEGHGQPVPAGSPARRRDADPLQRPGNQDLDRTGRRSPRRSSRPVGPRAVAGSHHGDPVSDPATGRRS
jgi:ABC-type transport system substrate-binding protein